MRSGSSTVLVAGPRRLRGGFLTAFGADVAKVASIPRFPEPIPMPPGAWPPKPRETAYSPRLLGLGVYDRQTSLNYNRECQTYCGSSGASMPPPHTYSLVGGGVPTKAQCITRCYGWGTDAMNRKNSGGGRLRGLGDVSVDLTRKTNYAREEVDVGSTISSLTLTRKVSKAPCTQGTDYGFSGSKAWVDHGCRGTFNAVTGPSTAYPDYTLVDQKLAKLIAQIQSCQSSSNVAMPSSWNLAPPGGAAPASVTAAYNSYALRIQELNAARQDAGALCGQAGAVSGPGYGTSPSQYNPYPANQQYGPGYQVGYPQGYSPRSAIIPDQGGAYGNDPSTGGADIYTPTPGTGQTVLPTGGASVVDNPFAPPTAAAAAKDATPPRSRKAAAYAVGAVALIGVAFVVMRKRSKSRRSR